MQCLQGSTVDRVNTVLLDRIGRSCLPVFKIRVPSRIASYDLVHTAIMMQAVVLFEGAQGSLFGGGCVEI